MERRKKGYPREGESGSYIPPLGPSSSFFLALLEGAVLALLPLHTEAVPSAQRCRLVAYIDVCDTVRPDGVEQVDSSILRLWS